MERLCASKLQPFLDADLVERGIISRVTKRQREISRVRLFLRSNTRIEALTSVIRDIIFHIVSSHMCTYMYVYLYTHVCTFKYTHTHTYVDTHARTQTIPSDFKRIRISNLLLRTCNYRLMITMQPRSL